MKKSIPIKLEDLLSVELVELEVGYGLVNLVDSSQNGDLLERITQIRKQFAVDWGIIIPSVKIKDNLELKPGGYSIKIKGIEIANGELVSDHYLAMDPGTVIEKIEGVETKGTSVWFTSSLELEDERKMLSTMDIRLLIHQQLWPLHLTEILKVNMYELFGREELNNTVQPKN